MIEIKRSHLAGKGFNINLVQCLPLYYVIINNVHVSSFTYTISHMHRLHLERFCVHKILSTKKL